MPVYFEYFLKATICLAIIFLFYHLLLKRMTYYTWNRFFLLTFSILSFIVPLINIAVFVEPGRLNSISLISEIPSIHSNLIAEQLPKSQHALTYYQTLGAVFLLVSSMLFIRLLIQLLSIRKIRSKATLLADGEVKLYHVSSPILPFSFLSGIFINKDNYTLNEQQKIIDHETIHVRQKHTVDVLLTEVICILNWYNPFAWLIKKAVRENLEFIADDAVIKKGTDKKNYQYLLLKITGHISSSIASNFKFSSLKNRIAMMNASKTSGFHLFKFVLLVPVIVLLLLAFRNRKEGRENIAVERPGAAEAFTLSKLTYSIPDNTVKNIVFKEESKSLLKTGEVFSLALVDKEKNRLRDLLEGNGYSNIYNGAITFLIDSSSANKSFSVQVNINVGARVVSTPAKRITSVNDGTNLLNHKSAESIKRVSNPESPAFNKRWELARINTFLNAGKTNQPSQA